MNEKQRSPVKGPCTLQLKLQKKSLTSIHTTTFFHNCNDFLNSFIWAKIFTTIVLEKIVVKIFVVCEGLYGALFCLLGNGDTWDRIFILLNLLYNYVKIVMKSCCKMVPGLTRSSMHGK